MKTTIQDICFMDPQQILNKLGQILVTLQHQKEEFQARVAYQTQALKKQLNKKNSDLQGILQKLQITDKKIKQLQQKLIQKDKTISMLNGRVKNLKKIFIYKINNFLNHLDLNVSENQIVDQKTNQSTKRINISEYFSKITEGNKLNCHKNQNLSTNNSNQNTKQENFFFPNSMDNKFKNISDQKISIHQHFATSLIHSKIIKQPSLRSISNCIQLNAPINFSQNKVPIEGKSSQGMKKFMEHYQHICNQKQHQQNRAININLTRSETKNINSKKNSFLNHCQKKNISTTLLSFK